MVSAVGRRARGGQRSGKAEQKAPCVDDEGVLRIGGGARLAAGVAGFALPSIICAALAMWNRVPGVSSVRRRRWQSRTGGCALPFHSGRRPVVGAGVP